MKRQVCAKCGSRHSVESYEGGKDCCKTCEGKSSSLPMRRSIRNTFNEIPLPSDPKALDVRTLIRDVQDVITTNLEKRLLENGYVIFKVFICSTIILSAVNNALHKYLKL